MPRIADPARQLEETITRLQERRRALTADLARIDALCERYGIQLQGRKGPGRPPGRRAAAVPGTRAGRRRKRGRFTKSALVSVADFVKAAGPKGVTTSEVNKHWKGEGRAGDAYVTLGQLTKLRKIKRKNLKGQRGSRYTAP